MCLDHPKNSPWVFKSDEGKGDSASIILQFNLANFSKFVEEILNVSLLDIHRKISHIDPSIGHGGGMSGTADTERDAPADFKITSCFTNSSGGVGG